jgi:prepilin-type N-terminal cleavage/methylation domain-containing protein
MTSYRKTLSQNTRSRKLHGFPTRPYVATDMKTPTKNLKAKINSAFSLVELLVVIAVIAVIAAIAIPNLVGIRESAEGARAEVTAETLDRLVESVVNVGAREGDAETGDQATRADLDTVRANLLGGSVYFLAVTNRGYAADGTETFTTNTTEFSLQNAATQD